MKIFSKIDKKCNCTICDLPGRFAIVMEFTFVASNEQLDIRAHSFNRILLGFSKIS